MVGKWHLGSNPGPIRRGFDDFYGMIDGFNSFWQEAPFYTRLPAGRPKRTYAPGQFYSTDAFTDRAIGFVKVAAADKAKPFFLYLPYNAPHWPLQAPESAVDAYKGVYDAGWQPVREARMKRMLASGLVPPGTEMAPMDRGTVRPWDQLTPAKRTEWARRMEVYAAQVSVMDADVGRLLATLKETGVDQNTLVLFLSDNGGAAEDPNAGDPAAEIGSRDSYRGYARPWATVSNTPWRLHKVTAYEGGISTPLIAAWPAGIPANKAGTQVNGVGHVVDFVPTFLALAHASYPADAVHPLEGRDIGDLLRGTDSAAERLLFWEHEGNRAVRKGRWKLVNLGTDPTWQLYDLQTDRRESHDLAKDRPEVVADLTAEWDRWTKRVGVVPWPEIEAKVKAATTTRPTTKP